MTANFIRRYGYVKKGSGHDVENTEDVAYMEGFRLDRCQEVSLSDRLVHSPRDTVAETLKIDPTVIADFEEQAGHRPGLMDWLERALPLCAEDEVKQQRPLS